MRAPTSSSWVQKTEGSSAPIVCILGVEEVKSIGSCKTMRSMRYGECGEGKGRARRMMRKEEIGPCARLPSSEPYLQHDCGTHSCSARQKVNRESHQRSSNPSITVHNASHAALSVYLPNSRMRHDASTVFQFPAHTDIFPEIEKFCIAWLVPREAQTLHTGRTLACSRGCRTPHTCMHCEDTPHTGCSSACELNEQSHNLPSAIN